MSKNILPNSSNYPLPPNATFGSELEGLCNVQPIFARCGKELLFTTTSADKHELLAQFINDDTNIPTTAGDTDSSYKSWAVKNDGTIQREPRVDPLYVCGAEIASPILRGNEGIHEIGIVFDALKNIGFRANESCGLHVHVSLGWNPTHTPSARSLQEIKNIYMAFTQNIEFFRNLITDDRLTNPYCQENKLLSKKELRQIDSLDVLAQRTNQNGGSQGHMLNLPTLWKYGTVEYRMKEAENYQDSLGYIRFMVAFTAEAANNPNIKPEAILAKYFTPTQTTYRPAIMPRPSLQPSFVPAAS